jgi:hypothetical protein
LANLVARLKWKKNNIFCVFVIIFYI